MSLYRGSPLRETVSFLSGTSSIFCLHFRQKRRFWVNIFFVFHWLGGALAHSIIDSGAGHGGRLSPLKKKEKKKYWLFLLLFANGTCSPGANGIQQAWENLLNNCLSLENKIRGRQYQWWATFYFYNVHGGLKVGIRFKFIIVLHLDFPPTPWRVFHLFLPVGGFCCLHSFFLSIFLSF